MPPRSAWRYSADERLACLTHPNPSAIRRGVAERLAEAVNGHVDLLLPFAATWSQAMALQLLPTNAERTLHNVRKTVDVVWDYAHASADPPLAAGLKKAVLAKAMAAVELHMVADVSADHASTREFVLHTVQVLERKATLSARAEDELRHFAAHSRLGMSLLQRFTVK